MSLMDRIIIILSLLIMISIFLYSLGDIIDIISSRVYTNSPGGFGVPGSDGSGPGGPGGSGNSGGPEGPNNNKPSVLHGNGPNTEEDEN